MRAAMGQIVTQYPLQIRSRAVLKTLLYRGFMILVTVGVAFAITGDIETSVNIGIVTNIIKTGLYYIYERLWDHISWGI